MGFEDMDDLNELDEMPPFEEDLILPEFDDEPGGGVSRTFKIIGALLVLLVVGIVAVLVWWAVGNDNGPSPNEQTSTAIVAMNATTFSDATLTREAVEATQTALVVAQVASQEAIATFESLQTATQEALIEQQTQTQAAAFAQQTQTQDAMNAAETATQEAALAQQTQAALDAEATGTAFAQLDATQAAMAQTQAAESDAMTATASAARSVTGQVIDEEGNIFGGVTLRLYRDDGDGIFNPEEDTAAETSPPATTPEPGEPQMMVYGDSVEESLQRETVDLWRFEGSAGDIVTVEANAGNPGNMDMYLVLLDSDEEPLVEDDDSGPELDALINGFELPEDGVYTIQVSSVSGPGPYTLTLAGEIAGPSASDDEDDDSEAESMQPRVSDGSYIMLAQLGADTPTPIPGGDTFITFTETDLEGAFAFEDLEPGIYWLVIDYQTLPDSIRALIPPTEELVIMVNVPVTGQVTFTVGVPPTPTPDDSIQQTQTSLAPTVTPEVLDSPTPDTDLATETVGPDMTATLDQFGLLSDFGASSGLEGGSGLTVLAIAAAGLIAMVFIARRLRTAA